MSKLLNILIVDDHTIFRNALSSLLKKDPDITNIFQASSGYEAIEICNNEDIQTVFMDIQMPGIDGFEATKIIHQAKPSIRIIALSMRDDPSSILEICSYGACGYLFKNTDLAEIKVAIATVNEGRTHFQKEISKTIINGFVENATGIMPFKVRDTISGNERKILEFICNGLTADEIASKIKLSKRTVEGIRSKLFLKTGTTNIGSLTAFAIRNRIVN